MDKGKKFFQNLLKEYYDTKRKINFLNDRKKFVDSLFVVTGFTFEDVDEDVNKRIKQSRIMEIPAENSDIKYITKSLNET